MPAVPPNSSSTTAIGWRAAFMRARTSITVAPCGTMTGGRISRRKLTSSSAERGAAAGGDAEQILGRQDADHVVDGLLVDREAAVAVAQGDAQRVLDARVDRQRDDLGARDHDFAGRLIAEGKGALDELALGRRHQAGPGRLGDQQLQLFRRVHDVLFAVVLEADRPQHQVGEQVQQADERSEHPGQRRRRAGWRTG